VEELRRLPVGSGVGVRLLQVLDDPSVGAAEIATLVEADASMTAHLLRLANAPFYGVAHEVASVAQAVRVCGFSVVRAFAAGAAAGVIVRTDHTMPPGFHEHAVVTAACASVVARRCGIDPGEGLCAGLLHDLGTALLHRHDRGAWTRASRLAQTDIDHALDAERQVLGTDHPTLAAAVLTAWRVPERLVQAIAVHHDPVGTHDAPLAAVLVAAEALATELLGPAASEPPAPPVADALHAAGWRAAWGPLIEESGALAWTLRQLLVDA
jgi:putative nucleotidyltransferase with HDIG domain